MTELHVIKSMHAVQGPIQLDVSLSIEKGEFVALYGPSGAGKTTLLRMLAGLERPEFGYMRFDGQTWYDQGQGVWIDPQHRPVGLVFQDYALFPNMTIREQLIFALPDKGNLTMVNQLLDIMNLGGLADRRPGVLSGGQQQRVALARAVARQPNLLLLDEPLSAVDAETRFRLQHEIEQVHRQFGLTTILVSHDTAEITRLASRVISLNEGKIERQGTPATVFASPESSLSTQWIGTVIAIELQGQQLQLTLQAEGMTKTVMVPQASIKLGDRIVLLA